MQHACVPPQSLAGPGVGEARRGRRQASERTNGAMFCQSSHIIMGVYFIFNWWWLDDGSFLRYRRWTMMARALSSPISWTPSEPFRLLHKWLNSASLPSIFRFAGYNHSSAASRFLCPSTCAHELWESRHPKRLQYMSSSVRVEGGNHVFWECCWRHDYPLCPLLPGARQRLSGDRHCFPSTLHRAGRLYRYALCRLVHLALPLGMFPLFAI